MAYDYLSCYTYIYTGSYATLLTHGLFAVMLMLENVIDTHGGWGDEGHTIELHTTFVSRISSEICPSAVRSFLAFLPRVGFFVDCSGVSLVGVYMRAPQTQCRPLVRPLRIRLPLRLRVHPKDKKLPNLCATLFPTLKKCFASRTCRPGSQSPNRSLEHYAPGPILILKIQLGCHGFRIWMIVGFVLLT